ncbi:DNA integrity scanning protein DisA nucleotide-binding domain protein [Thermodesulforhabdus norvegica]|uniref:DisA checkpoint controller nucleotide-binding n=1 Tax=Thermodesulforhabdus norvegica TaxID=39841 RepID=A0A1I4QPH7_9BACT|nr:DNA integrity scanning protein DisA nucleotide-binding domain protein [Thermodesulforhabdus norvegica]SFM41625.1 DisA checkpoint controller nucleotide-binding [Thermodesulforhabdus norvegica]
MNYASKKLRIVNVLEGLMEGLSDFCGPTRAALIYAEHPEDPLRIWDPFRLLDGHEPRLKELYVDSEKWRECELSLEEMRFFGEMVPEKDIGLSGVISYGGRTGAIFYQMWFVDHHPDLCSRGPVERWLEHAVCMLSHDFVTEDAFYTASSRYVLREYAKYAVRDYILDELNLLIGWDMPYHVTSVLDVILGLSKLPEEGSLPEGRLAVVEPKICEALPLAVKFPSADRPLLKNLKHVRKLLTAVRDNPELALISDGTSIIGIGRCDGKLPSVVAEFKKTYGFVHIGENPVCSFSEGKFYATNRQPHLVELEELLLEADLEEDVRDEIFRICLTIVRRSVEEKHGCAIVVDLNEAPIPISGQRLDKPLDLSDPENLKLACALSKLDGAVHIGRDLRLHGFSCLLDGFAVPGEDRSRGARYNSAMRFTAQHPGVIVIAVSADRPVAVFQEGVDVTGHRWFENYAEDKIFKTPMTLKEWLGL